MKWTIGDEILSTDLHGREVEVVLCRGLIYESKLIYKSNVSFFPSLLNMAPARVFCLTDRIVTLSSSGGSLILQSHAFNTVAMQNGGFCGVHAIRKVVIEFFTAEGSSPERLRSVCVEDTIEQRFSNCGPRTTSGPRVLPLWSF